ncbi:energy transducer TonB [Roseovarius sp. EL26]|uniref:energy transducer TonB n=1 Tax=Roseovarius sp. EL26 TaxID=2126672 RepID=UPI00349F3D35
MSLIMLAIFGGAFRSEPLPTQVTEVTAISSEDFAALLAQEQSPEAVANIDTPEPPEAGEVAPDLSSETDEAPEVETPEAAQPETPDDVPDVSEITPPVETDFTDEAPVLQPPPEDVAAVVPQISPRPQQRPADRIAPEAVAQPEPDVKIDDVDQQETQPDEAAEIVEDDKEETAREEAATQIVTEAEEEKEIELAAPTASVRPKPRPSRPVEDPVEPAAQEVPATNNNAVEDALAEALGTTQTDTRPSGPPLTSGEKDALRLGVQQCWNVGSLSTDALQTTVVVAFDMSQDGKPVRGSIQMVSSSGGTSNSARQAYDAARRAILRCGSKGYDLPVEKYDRWREVEITFNPENMRIK